MIILTIFANAQDLDKEEDIMAANAVNIKNVSLPSVSWDLSLIFSVVGHIDGHDDSHKDCDTNKDCSSNPEISLLSVRETHFFYYY